jgi:hypothetical protein
MKRARHIFFLFVLRRRSTLRGPYLSNGFFVLFEWNWSRCGFFSLTYNAQCFSWKNFPQQSQVNKRGSLSDLLALIVIDGYVQRSSLPSRDSQQFRQSFLTVPQGVLCIYPQRILILREQYRYLDMIYRWKVISIRFGPRPASFARWIFLNRSTEENLSKDLPVHPLVFKMALN